MLSGLYPHTHGVQQPRRERFPASRKLLSEILKERGYKTIGITGGGYVAANFGFARGFDVYLQQFDYIPAESLRQFDTPWAVKRAREELNKLDSTEPYFVFLHTYDVHCPYAPVTAFKGKFNSLDAEEIDATICRPEHKLKRPLRAGEALYLSDRYDESIAAVDHSLEEFFSYLKSRADYDKTVIVITADHGEDFLEHGDVGHVNSLHRELLAVPLIMRVPGMAPRRIPQHVNLVDVVPTVLDVLNMDAGLEMDGMPLTPLITAVYRGESIRPFEYSELNRGRSLRSRLTDKTHLIYDAKTGKSLFYDLENDPLEKINLARTAKNLFEPRYEELQAYLRSLEITTSEVSYNEEENDKNLERLKTLGYF